MASEKSSAIVLRLVEFSETSLIVTLFTRDFGKVTALAKGARRPKGPFEAALDLLSLTRIVFLRKSAGRVIIIILASLTALGGLVSLVFTLGSAVSSVAGVTIGLIQAGSATLILCLAAAGSTGRWIRAAQQRPSYPQGGYQRY